ncbi:MAG: hypothetical protein K2X32_02525 [Phycisphaerales bacterium]|nr:hypothetical protein [Phycisphaerales bacterium]
MPLPTSFYNFRRWALRTFVPESYWPEFVVLNGVKIQLRNTPYSFGVRSILRDNTYEIAERTLIVELARPGMQVLELGGSIGIIAAVVAQCVGPTGRVVSVEASPKLTSFSKTWLENGRPIKVLTGYAFPVWNLPAELNIRGFTGGEVSLGGRVEFSFDQQASAGGAVATAAPRTANPAEPRSYDLSTICAEQGIQPEMLIMDIEGSEEILMKYPGKFPAFIKTVIVELHPWMYKDGERDQQRIIEAIEREGFTMTRRVKHNWLFQR